MTVQIPFILNNDAFIKDESLILWNESMPDYFAYKVQNSKLVNILWGLNHKATIGLVAALSEWVFWRLSAKRDVSVAINAIESIWLSLIDKSLLKNWKYTSHPEDTIYKNILWVIFKSHFFIKDNYIKGDYQIQYRVMNLAMLARHITPEKEMFDSWLSDCLSRATKLFPAQYDRGDVMEHPENYPKYYDSTAEPVIPREFFFEPGFNYETSNNNELLKRFVNNLNHSNKVFFFTPEELLERGFTGKPYTYEK